MAGALALMLAVATTSIKKCIQWQPTGGTIGLSPTGGSVGMTTTGSMEVTTTGYKDYP
jgi:hypothetical protein